MTQNTGVFTATLIVNHHAGERVGGTVVIVMATLHYALLAVAMGMTAGGFGTLYNSTLHV